jgi:hypothetical protein
VFHNINRDPVSVTVSLGDGSKTWSFVLDGGENTGFGFTVEGGETSLEVISRRGLSQSKTFGMGYLGSYTSECFWLVHGPPARLSLRLARQHVHGLRWR